MTMAITYIVVFSSKNCTGKSMINRSDLKFIQKTFCIHQHGTTVNYVLNICITTVLPGRIYMESQLCKTKLSFDASLSALCALCLFKYPKESPFIWRSNSEQMVDNSNLYIEIYVMISGHVKMQSIMLQSGLYYVIKIDGDGDVVSLC